MRGIMKTNWTAKNSVKRAFTLVQNNLLLDKCWIMCTCFHLRKKLINFGDFKNIVKKSRFNKSRQRKQFRE